MKKALAVLFILLATNIWVSAKTKKFVWEDEICVYEGSYNGALYTKKQLENTYRLWFTHDFELLAWQGKRQVGGLMEPFTIEWLDYQYAVKSSLLRELKIVNTPYWRDIKRRKLRAMEQQYILERLTFQASGNFSVLRELKFADICREKFAEPLIAGDASLLRIWREENEQARKGSVYAEDIRKDFESRMASNDRLKYARAEVLTGGWWNCVNAQIDRGGDDGVMHKNFRKLFKRVREMGCDYA